MKVKEIELEGLVIVLPFCPNGAEDIVQALAHVSAEHVGLLTVYHVGARRSRRPGLVVHGIEVGVVDGLPHLCDAVAGVHHLPHEIAPDILRPLFRAGFLYNGMICHHVFGIPDPVLPRTDGVGHICEQIHKVSHVLRRRRRLPFHLYGCLLLGQQPRPEIPHGVTYGVPLLARGILVLCQGIHVRIFRRSRLPCQLVKAPARRFLFKHGIKRIPLQIDILSKIRYTTHRAALLQFDRHSEACRPKQLSCSFFVGIHHITFFKELNRVFVFCICACDPLHIVYHDSVFKRPKIQYDRNRPSILCDNITHDDDPCVIWPPIVISTLQNHDWVFERIWNLLYFLNRHFRVVFQNFFNLVASHVYVILNRTQSL